MPEQLRQLIALALLMLALGAGIAHASDADQLARVMGPRPDIHDYTSQDQFVQDLLAWKARRAELKRKLAHGERIAPPLPPKHYDWHHITGPEDLDTALKNAKGYVAPHYKAKKRYNRTTHLSFPLPHLSGGQMASESISGALEKVPQKPAKQDESGLIPEKLLEDTEQIQRDQPPQSHRLTAMQAPTHVEAQVDLN
ncbi:MAG: hypothetical protein R3292_10855 [Alcanivorax sp.]|nr:hypothetical protein [Alcanivorax sp.]